MIPSEFEEYRTHFWGLSRFKDVVGMESMLNKMDFLYKHASGVTDHERIDMAMIIANCEGKLYELKKEQNQDERE